MQDFINEIYDIVLFSIEDISNNIRHVKFELENKFLVLNLMGFSHEYTSKQFDKRLNPPSDNHIGFRYMAKFFLPI